MSAAPAARYTTNVWGRPRRPARILAWECGLLVLVGAASVAVGQPAANRDERTLSATLPASNEAMLLAGQVRQAIEQGDYRLAIALIERLMERSAELIAIPPGRTFYPVWRQAAGLLRHMPPTGLQVYRQLFDAEVATRLEDARRRGDISALRELFRHYPGSSAWPAVGHELVAQLLDQGCFTEAIHVLRLMAEADVPRTPEGRAQLVAALGRVGQFDAAQRELAELEAEGAAAPRAGWPQRLQALRVYVEELAAGHGASLRRDRFEPAWSAGPVWQEKLEPAGPGEYFDEDSAIADGAERLRRLPLHAAVVDGGVLVTRLRGMVYAFDTLTLTHLWRVRELSAAMDRNDGELWSRIGTALQMIESGEAEVGVSADALILLTHALRHAVSTGFGLVFTVESLPPPRLGSGEWGAGRFAELSGAPVANELVARELATGRLAWRQGGEADQPLYRVAFQGAPVVVGDRLCVAFQRGNSLHVALLSPTSGQVLREAAVVGPPTYFSPSGGRCPLTADETTVYVCTGNGVVAALSHEDLSWQWATTYPSTLAERRATDWWPPRRLPREFGVERPVIIDDAIVLAPVDSPYLLALERFSGRQRWRVERGAYECLIGAVDAGVVVAGDSVACLDPADGTRLRWRSVPLEPAGQPTIRGPQVYVPTRDGVVVLDARTGKVVTEPAVRDAARRAAQRDGSQDWASEKVPPTANLVCTNEALFAVSPSAVVRYADLGATRHRAQALLADDASHERAKLALAWVQRLSGAYEQALSTLEEIAPTEPALTAARERLLTDVCVALAAQTEGGAQRLRWLRQAERLAVAGDSGGRLTVLIGHALEDGGAWDEAAAHYGERLRARRDVLVDVPDDPPREMAGWFYAVYRLRDVLPRLDERERRAVLESWLAEAEPGHLLRLRLAVGDAGVCRRIDRALALSSLPPELRAAYLPAGDDSDLPAEERRRLHLARWETHVALGLVAEALADQHAWYRQYAVGSPERAAQPADEVPESEEARRIRRIETSLSKLLDAEGLPFARDLAARYQWKLRKAELIVDPQRPGDALRGWIPVRNLEERQLALHSAVLGREWHRTVDALESGLGGQAALEQATEEIVYGQTRDEGRGSRTAWPAAIQGFLAAVPVRGGLVCIGLGPERGAGRRLWEHALPEWGGIPVAFEDWTTAGPLGVYVARRGDRVALIGWSDGQVWWQRELPAVRVRQLFLAGERLVVVGQDDTVLSLDATFGDQLRVFPSTWGTARAVTTIGNQVVLAGDEALSAFNPETWERIWTRPAHGVAAWTAATGAPWLAYRDRRGGEWSLLDARTGQAVFAQGLGDLGESAVVALDDRQVLAAGMSPKAGAPDAMPTVRIAAFDAADGRLRWTCEIQTLARVNATQLLAHPEVIPVLVAADPYEFSEGTDYRTLRLVAVDKETGQISEPISIEADFEHGAGTCAAYVLATPSRIIVQANGTLVAYGSGLAKRAP